jgi:hypothetical protein
MTGVEEHPEHWKPVTDFEGLYDVSSWGHVKSLARLDRRGRAWPERILKPGKLPKSGHRLVMLCADGVTYPRYVHRLVAREFIGECPEGQETRHKDNDPSNNHDWNLHYGTRSDNVQDMLAAGHHQNQNTDKPECDYGHPLSGDNLTIVASTGERRCKICNARRTREGRERHPKPSRPPVEHGTKEGYNKHQRQTCGWTMPACDPCREAVNRYKRERNRELALKSI